MAMLESRPGGMQPGRSSVPREVAPDGCPGVRTDSPARTEGEVNRHRIAGAAGRSWLLIAPVALISIPQPEPPPSGQWQRLSITPIIAPRGDGWESAGTFNPAVVAHEGRIVMLYRAQDRNGTSRLGYASSSDGVAFERRDAPVVSPEADYERDGGVEDPRLVKFGDTYYLTYTGYNKKDAQLCLAVSRDLVRWERKG